MESLQTFYNLNIGHPEYLDKELKNTEFDLRFVEYSTREYATAVFGLVRSISVLGVGRHAQKLLKIQALPVKPMFYMRASMKDVTNKELAVAQGMDLASVRATEPASSILDLMPETSGFLRFGYER